MDIEVTIQSTLPSAPGQVTISLRKEDLVERLIVAFCSEKEIMLEDGLLIRNRKRKLLAATKTLQQCNVRDKDVVYLGVLDNTTWPMGCNQWWLLAGVALLIGGIGLVATTLVRANGRLYPDDYGVVIDAGSSHSQIFVYKWDGEKENGTAMAKQTFTCKAKGGGISSYADNPPAAGTSLEACLRAAEGAVPEDSRAKTPVFLGATAGMRLLAASDPPAALEVMNSVRETLNKSRFAFPNASRQARILDGAEEGSFGWVTVNYLSGALTTSLTQYLYDTWYGTVALKSSGALDMGGASTQITFVPENPASIHPGYKENLLMYGRNYEVYTHSYLCFGANEALRKLKAHLVKSQKFNTSVTNPCGPKGNTTSDTYSDIFEVPCTLNKSRSLPGADENTTFHFEGSSDSEACRAAVQTLFDFNASCGATSEHCAFDGVYQPPVFGQYKAFSSYFFTAEFLNLTVDGDTFPLQEFRNKTQEFCAKSWQEISTIPSSNPDFLTKYCFDAHYIDIILTEGYKFNESNWRSISFVKDVAHSDVGWTLGFMLNVSNRIPAEYPRSSVSTPLFIVLLVLFSIFVGLAMGLACHAKKKSKPPTKSYVRLGGSSYGAI